MEVELEPQTPEQTKAYLAALEAKQNPQEAIKRVREKERQ